MAGTGLLKRLTLPSQLSHETWPLSSGTPMPLSHFSVCKFKCPWSRGLVACPSTRGESLCPYKSSFELIICLFAQSTSLCIGKIILPSGPGSEGFRALAEKWEEGSDRWFPRGRAGAVGLFGDWRAGCPLNCHELWVWPWAGLKALKLCLDKWKGVIQGDAS